MKVNKTKTTFVVVVVIFCLLAFNNCGKPFRVSTENPLSLTNSSSNESQPGSRTVPSPTPSPSPMPTPTPQPLDSGIGCKMNLKNVSQALAMTQKLSDEAKFVSTMSELNSSESDLSKERAFREGEFIIQLKNHSLNDQSRRLKNHAVFKGNSLDEDQLQKQLKQQLTRIQLEQEQLENILKQISTKAVIESSRSELLNAVHVSGLTDEQAEELKRRGYKVQRNFKIHFMSYGQHPAIQYAPNFATMSSIVSQVGASALHSQGYKGNGIKIGIIDTGIEGTHIDFAGKSVIGWSNCPGGQFNDEIGHGTHVASIAAGTQGVAPQAQIYMYKVTCNDFSSGAIEALQRAIADGVQVVNMSFSVGIGPDDPLALAIDAAVAQGVVVVAAAGNCTDSSGPCNDNMRTQGIRNPLNGQQVIGSPAAARSAIAVGITDKNSQLAQLIGLPGPTVWMSGSATMTLAKPDLVAPAQEICAAGSQTIDMAYSAFGMNAISGKPGFFGWCDEQHAVLSGTSMAAPLVTGAVALLRQAHPDWNPDEIKAALKNKAVVGAGNLSTLNYFDRGSGTLNILNSTNISGKPPVARLSEVEYHFSKTKGLTVSGTAADRDTSVAGKFKEYRVYYGKGRNPTSYALLKTSKVAVNQGVLFETAGLTDCSGEIVFKLETEDMNGNISRDYSIVKID